MSVSTAGHAGSAGRREFVLRALLFVVAALAAVAAVTTTDAWWTTALGLASVAFALAGIVLALALLAGGEADADPATGRGRAVVLGVVTAVTLLLAVTLPQHAGAGPAPSARDEAQDTVRQFLVAAVLNDDAYLACQYLTPGERRRVARQEGRSGTCQEAFIAASPAFAGLRHVSDLEGLALRASAAGDRAVVRVSRPPQPPLRFVLRRATPRELAEFHAPQVPWRIAAGATAVLRA